MLREMAGIPPVSLEFLGGAGEALVIAIPVASRLVRETEFWVKVASSSTISSIGWMRFERRLIVGSKALFEATELRSADSEAPAPERVLQLWQHLEQGGI